MSAVAASCLTASIGYTLRGWSVFPLHGVLPSGECACGNIHCTDIGKHPLTSRGFKDASTDPSVIVGWWGQWPNANVGIPTGLTTAIVVLDVDPRHDGPDSLLDLEKKNAPLPETIEVVTGSGGRHIYFRSPGVPLKLSAGKIGRGLDIRADGGYVVAPPSLHASGNRYEWEASHHPDDVALADLPPWLLALLTVAPTNGHSKPSNGQPTVIPDGQRNSRLASIAGSMRRQGADEAAILAALRQVNASQCAPPLPDADVCKIAASISGYAPAVTPTPSTPILRPLTDLGNAERLGDQHGVDLRYTSEADWHAWNGVYWERDTTGETPRRAFAVVRHIPQEAVAINDPDLHKATLRFALASEARPRIEAMVKLAQSLPAIALPFNAFDRHPWLLTCANGTIDLTTGGLRDHRREDMVTKAVAAPYDPTATAPVWLTFLDKIMSGNAALIAFLQRAIGYSITGSTRERVVFILHGSGGNGKTTFLRTIQALLGEGYGQRTPVEMFMKRKDGAIPSDIARLRGARFAYASESEDGRQLSEATIKDLAGDEPITARFMHRDWFQFRPEVKLWLGTNHRPTIRGTDNAIWDRIKLIPFAVRIPEAEKDKDLEAKLSAEYPGILAWAVRGCLDWQSGGLGVPDEIRRATEGYRDDMDTLRRFIGERCVISKAARVKGGDLWQVYQEWCKENGEWVGTAKALARRVEEMGFINAGRSAKGTIWGGLGLLDAAQQESLPASDDSADSDLFPASLHESHSCKRPGISSLSSLSSLSPLVEDQELREFRCDDSDDPKPEVDINEPWQPPDTSNRRMVAWRPAGGEWEPVPRDTADVVYGCPPGLEYRLNANAGTREARWPDGKGPPIEPE